MFDSRKILKKMFLKIIFFIFDFTTKKKKNVIKIIKKFIYLYKRVK